MTQNQSQQLSLKQLSDVLGYVLSQEEYEDCLVKVRCFNPKVGKFWQGTGVEAGIYIAIAHWEDKHYIVVYEITATSVIIADPAIGQISLSYREFQINWTGYLLLIEPTALLKDAKDSSTRNFNNRMGKDARVYLGSAELAAVCALLGRIPSMQEYLEIVGQKIEPFADNLYRYLNFDQIANFADEGRVISKEEEVILEVAAGVR
jgi:hypothetical protein